jgi:hypothetical protein
MKVFPEASGRNFYIAQTSGDTVLGFTNDFISR